LQPPAEVGSLGDVRLGVGIVSAEEKDSRGRRDGSKYLGIAGWDEVEAGEHEVIVVAKLFTTETQRKAERS
jgi:hypothetical protein